MEIRYIKLTDEIQRYTALLFAPLGAARTFDHPSSSSPSALLGVEELREGWTRTLDAVAEATYRHHGLTEGTVALTSHLLLEEQHHSGAAHSVRRTQDAVSDIASPPRVVELPDSDIGPDEILAFSDVIASTCKIVSGESAFSEAHDTRALGGMYPEAWLGLGFEFDASVGSQNRPSLDMLVGRKARVRAAVDALAAAVKNAPLLSDPAVLQAYAEATWDTARARDDTGKLERLATAVSAAHRVTAVPSKALTVVDAR